MEEENTTKINVLSIIFKITYFIALIGLLYFYFFDIGRNISMINGDLINFKEFIIMLPLLIIPLLIPVKELKYKLLSFIGLAIILTTIGIIWIHYGEWGDLIFYIYALVILIIIIISHYLLRYVDTKANKLVKIMGVIILLIILISYTAYFISSKAYFQDYLKISESNDRLINEIKCKGAYTTTDSLELKNLCDQIEYVPHETTHIHMVHSNEAWREFKAYCEEVVKKVQIDKYYFDEYGNAGYFFIRNPSLFDTNCNPEQPSPEILDPYLCDVLAKSNSKILQEYFDNPKRTGPDCYERVVAETGQIELCEKSSSPQSCYLYVAKVRDDKRICDELIRYPLVRETCLDNFN